MEGISASLAMFGTVTQKEKSPHRMYSEVNYIQVCLLYINIPMLKYYKKKKKFSTQILPHLLNFFYVLRCTFPVSEVQ